VNRESASVNDGGSPMEGPPPPGFSQVFILKGLKVVCFDTLLQVLILKTLTFEKNCADLTAKGRFQESGVSQ
jgi:hypothetical protein